MLPVPLNGMGSCMSSALQIYDLSLLMVYKTQTKMELKGSSQEKEIEKYDNDGGSKSNQKYRSKGDLKATKGSE